MVPSVSSDNVNFKTHFALIRFPEREVGRSLIVFKMITLLDIDRCASQGTTQVTKPV